MRIANKTIPIAPGHEIESVVSNAVYLLTALGKTAVLGPAVLPVTLPMAFLATGSALFHATDDSQIWAQLLDAIPIQWVMSGLVVLSVAAVTGWPLWAVSVPLPAVWSAWWLWGHKVRRNPAVAVQGALVLLALVYTGQYVEAGASFALISAALAVQVNAPTHGLLHSAWHVLACAAIAVATWGLV